MMKWGHGYVSCNVLVGYASVCEGWQCVSDNC
jgi:hypothetical protein